MGNQLNSHNPRKKGGSDKLAWHLRRRTNLGVPRNENSNRPLRKELEEQKKLSILIERSGAEGNPRGLAVRDGQTYWKEKKGKPGSSPEKSLLLVLAKTRGGFLRTFGGPRHVYRM